MTTPEPGTVLLWLNKFGNDYEVLKFLLTNPHMKQTLAVLHVLESRDKKIPLIEIPSGKEFDIYTEILRTGSKSYQIPELKNYPQSVQAKFRSDLCWVQWAGIFDRNLTSEQRKILTHYRTAFVCLLVHEFIDEAELVLKMAETPMSGGKITGEFLYSRDVLRACFEIKIE